MSVFSNFWELVNQHKESSFNFDMDFWEPQAQHIYLKRLAIDTCVNFVARSFTQSEFKVMKGQKANKKADLYYYLNVQPNPNQTASEFWHKFVYKLLTDGEVLAVQTDTGDLVIADAFVHNEMALYPDSFDGVTVGTYTYDRRFYMEDVLYLTYGNAPLSRYVTSLFDDTAELYSRIYEVALRDKQVRGTVKVGALQGTDAQKQAKLQNYIDMIFQQFTKRSVAIVPNTQGLDYEESSNASYSRGTSSIEDLQTIKNQFLDDVAGLIGVPPVLLHGQTAQTDQSRETYMDYCLRPLKVQIEAAANAIFFNRAEYRRGEHIEIVGLDRADMTKLAEPLDKLRAGGFVNGDEGRVLLGLDPTGNKEMQEYYVTKNYENATNKGTNSTDVGADNPPKGGEDENGKDSD